MHDLSKNDFEYLLDEVLFELHTRNLNDADQADPLLDSVIARVARQERLSPSPDDARAITALAYEQLRGYQP